MENQRVPPAAAATTASPPPPTTYVVKFPRDQILRYPPPENAIRFQILTRKKKRNLCRRCCCYTFCFVFLLIAAGASTGVLKLVFRFKPPNYTITNLSISSLNLTSSSPNLSGFDVTIRVENPNRNMGIYYLKGSAVGVLYNKLQLSNGVLLVFYQPSRNVTVLQTALTGSDVVLGGAVTTALRNSQSQGRVSFEVKVNVPVKIKVGSVNSWKITISVICHVVMDGVNQRSKIVSNDCRYYVRILPWWVICS